MMNAAKKVLDRDTLKEKVDSLRQAGKQVVFTNGCFDLLHIGHVRYLQEARQLGDCLVVAVNSDSSVRQIKEPGRPIMPEDQRAEVVAALGCVDWVTIFDEPDPLDLIRLLKPDVLVKGTDWSEEEIVGAPEVREAGGQVLRIPLVQGSSTSGIMKKVRSAAEKKTKGQA
ncbi:MAG: D-glycero-beta-D-manno-heptose 1-phosphate adenylyltransferase [Deltaproteobacteria bacterium]|nr:D-glycero-beta-D-manno-heptose 1-phosphate adenylyltransferase [Deltaproteobacteria bacterium]